MYIIMVKHPYRKCNYGKHPLKGSLLTGNIYAITPFLVIDPVTFEVKGGVAYDILKTVAQHYDFAYDIKFSHQLFILFPNGTLGGALGEVILSLLSCYIHKNRC